MVHGVKVVFVLSLRFRRGGQFKLLDCGLIGLACVCISMLFGVLALRGGKASRCSGLGLYGAPRHPPALPDSTAFEARDKTTGNKFAFVRGRLGSAIKKASGGNLPKHFLGRQNKQLRHMPTGLGDAFGRPGGLHYF